MSEQEEVLALVDINDQVIGSKLRREPTPAGCYMRFVNGLIFNDKGKVWVPKRAPHKTIAPGGYDFSVGGHVRHGESYDQAFLRELTEETGLHQNQVEYEFLGKLGPLTGSDRISAVYKVYTNAEPIVDVSEFQSAEWLTLHEYKALLQSGAPAKSDILPTINMYFRKGGSYGDI